MPALIPSGMPVHPFLHAAIFFFSPWSYCLCFSPPSGQSIQAESAAPGPSAQEAADAFALAIGVRTRFASPIDLASCGCENVAGFLLEMQGFPCAPSARAIESPDGGGPLSPSGKIWCMFGVPSPALCVVPGVSLANAGQGRTMKPAGLNCPSTTVVLVAPPDSPASVRSSPFPASGPSATFSAELAILMVNYF